jgi:hypothetical protein
MSLGTALGTSAAAGGMIIAGTTLAGASAGLQFLGQSQVASAQESAWKQTAALTNADLKLKYQQMALRELEERQSFSQQSMEIGRRTAKAVGFTQAAAGEGGVYGNSINMLLQDFGRQQADALFALRQNADMRSRQLGLESLSLQNQGIANINRAAPDTWQPSFLSPILQTAGAGFNLAAMNIGPGFGAASGGGGAVTQSVASGQPAFGGTMGTRSVFGGISGGQPMFGGF